MRIEKIQKENRITIGLLAVNILTFIVLSFLGDTQSSQFMYDHGAVFAPAVIENGEYYRLFTSMFLHFDFSHLMNNMIMLGALGTTVEPELGSIKTLILYLLSGLGGNLLSLGADWTSGALVVSAGASGAIFGLMGALVWLVIRNRGGYGRIYGRRVYLMVGLSLYYGFTSTGVDNYAHVGGLICGFLLAICLYRKRGKEKIIREEKR